MMATLMKIPLSEVRVGETLCLNGETFRLTATAVDGCVTIESESDRFVVASGLVVEVDR